MTCHIPFSSNNFWNVAEASRDSLPDTIWFGRPILVKMECSISMSLAVSFTMTIFSHFVCASVQTRSILPCTGPAKSICSLCYGWAGYSQWCKGAALRFLATSWHPWHFFAWNSMSLWRLGYHTYPHAKPFIWTIPIWPSWIVWRTLSLSFWGNYDSGSPHHQDLATMHWDFIFASQVRFYLWIIIIHTPPWLTKFQDLWKHWIPTCKQP